VREARDRAEVEPEVTDALAELHAIHGNRAAADEPDRERKIEKYELVLVQHPETLAARYTIKELSKLNAKEIDPPTPEPRGWEQAQPVTPRPRYAPKPEVLKTLPQEKLGRMWMRTWYNAQLESRDPLVRASASLQLGTMAEEDGLADEARAHYEDAAKTAPGSPAARRAEERLAKLGR
jgi:hypothetical protein